MIAQEAQKMAGVESPSCIQTIAEGDIMYIGCTCRLVLLLLTVSSHSPQAENVWLPNADDIEAAVREILNY